MAYLTKHTVDMTLTATTDTDYTDLCAHGFLRMITYVKSTGTALSGTADLSITTENSSQNLLTSLAVGTASFQKVPCNTVVNTTNAAVTNAYAYIPIADERIKITVAKATSTGQEGRFEFWMEGN